MLSAVNDLAFPFQTEAVKLLPLAVTICHVHYLANDINAKLEFNFKKVH